MIWLILKKTSWLWLIRGEFVGDVDEIRVLRIFLKVEQVKLVQGLLFTTYLTLNELLNVISASMSLCVKEDNG